MYCDMFRLCLSFNIPIDEQRLFNIIINRIPLPPKGWEDFESSAEWIMCLLMILPEEDFNLTVSAKELLSG